MLTQWAKTAFLSGLDGVTGGTLTVACPDRTYRYGEPGELDAALVVHDDRFFLRALTGSDVGLGESFMDGDWTTPDLIPLVRLMLRSRRALEGSSLLAGALQRLAGGIARRLRDNSLAGSRRHVHRHYDLGNEFFGLFLDRELRMYSCGYFESAVDSLEQAQATKVDRICRALKLSHNDHVLEIGSGWGGFAVWASTHYGCRVTTTTISDEQYRHVRDWRTRIGEAGSRIDVLRADYRELTGAIRQDRQHRNVRGGRSQPLRRLLQGRGSAAGARRLDAPADHHRRRPVVPEVSRHAGLDRDVHLSRRRARVGRRDSSLARDDRHRSRCITPRTSARTTPGRCRRGAPASISNLDRVRALGHDERFIRMWDLYLGSCEATFLERHTGLFQLMLLKNGARRRLFNEPWSDVATAPQAAGATESAA